MLFIFKFNLDKMNVIEIWIIYQVGIRNDVPCFNIKI